MMDQRPVGRRRRKRDTMNRVLETLAQGQALTMLGTFRGERTPFQILIGTILSARSRDEMTEKVCDTLFQKYPTPERLARANHRQLSSMLRVIGFYRQKASFIIETARMIEANHGGRVPETLHELLQLPGVGRKVANCVLVYAFAKPAIAVDTHVHRISNRLGWVDTRTPEETERLLTQILPERHWLTINELLVAHGKAICRPVGPKCSDCRVVRWCRQRGVTVRRQPAAGNRKKVAGT